MRLSIAVLALALLAACEQGPGKEAKHPVVKMAMFDLDCQESELHFKRIDEDTWGVRGCGHRAKYVRLCRQKAFGIAVQDECRWVQN
jgi:hypothetical protein